MHLRGLKKKKRAVLKWPAERPCGETSMRVRVFYKLQQTSCGWALPKRVEESRASPSPRHALKRRQDALRARPPARHFVTWSVCQPRKKNNSNEMTALSSWELCVKYALFVFNFIFWVSENIQLGWLLIIQRKNHSWQLSFTLGWRRYVRIQYAFTRHWCDLLV